MTPLVVDSEPKNFSPKWITTALHLEYNERFLVLKKAAGKWSEHLWGVPCGRREENETVLQTIQRESLEEIGWKGSLESFQYVAPLYVLYPDYSYVFHMFYVKLENKIPIQLSEEHVDYQWLKPEEFDFYPLIPGQKKALGFFLKMRTQL
jgi:8-oxo-dGTP pyrophosphatase MutT (NUDIX family)